MTGRRPSFSQRMGLAPLELPLQTHGMSDNLRLGLWNALANHLQAMLFAVSLGQPESRTLAYRLADEFFGWDVDTITRYGDDERQRIKLAFQALAWERAYDFIEYLANESFWGSHLTELWNEVLERENSAYRFVGSVIVPITNEHELATITTAAENLHPFPNAHEHLTKAAQLLGDRLNPDYANSIKESISAIEALCQALTGKPKATLGDALKYLEDQGIIHGALKATFAALYGYTSDAAGIRHGKGFGADRPDQADARFILITCSAFINYVIAKQVK